MANDDYLKPILDLAAAVGTKGVTSVMGWPEQIKNAVGSTVDAAKLPGDVVTGKVDPLSDEGVRRAVDLAGSMTLGAGAMEAPAGALHAGLMRPKSEGIIAYHGSPHSFDRFDLSKIGTGEGAQAYGHGLYFAEAEPVAKQYREFLSSRNNDLTDPGNLAASLLYRTPEGTREAAIREAQTVLRSIERMPAAYKHDPGVAERTKRALEMLQNGEELPAQGGHMYQVRINADPEHFLDYDRPLADQPQPVRDILSQMPAAPDPSTWPHFTGRDLHEQLRVDAMGDDAFMHSSDYPHQRRREAAVDVAKALREAGVPGIKYLDQGSRAVGEGSRNYVVFDDNLIDILRKYAKGGEVGGILADRYPSHYMPGVGRQVMQDGGAPNYSAPITGQHTITLDDLIGRAPGPASQMGAYTDAGGQRISAPFVTSTAGGYPVYSPQTQPEKASNPYDVSGLLGRIFGKGRLGFAEGGVPEVDNALSVARGVGA